MLFIDPGSFSLPDMNSKRGRNGREPESLETFSRSKLP